MKNIKNIVFTSLFIVCCLSVFAQQKTKKDESNIKKNEYSIVADTNKLIHITIFPTTNKLGTIQIKILNIYGETVANYVINENGEEKENKEFVYNSNEAIRFSFEYFIEITINEKKYNEEVEFPH